MGREVSSSTGSCSLDLRAFSRPALDGDRPAESLDPVGEAHEARAAGRIGTADTVVANRENDAAVALLERNVDPRRIGMLRRVGESLGRDVVRRHLDRLGESCVDLDVEIDGDRRDGRERAEGRAKPTLREDGRMDSPRDLLKILDRLGQPACDPRELVPEVLPVRRNVGLGGAHGQSQRDEPLLRPVMEVALDPAACLVRRGDDAPPGGGELRLAVRVRDRDADEVGELLQALLGVGR